ncbi:DUF4133 domain-containing protein [Dyadobacter sp. 32]|uniref:DUF4133 domain-containing protein n=1 Tax=Dyadobacter sp. 32 TaxID=538966 RepID=UPI0011EED449
MGPGSVYQINKGINTPIEFKGLKAQYIWYMGAAAIILFGIYALLYSFGVRSYICVGIVILLGIPMIMGIYHLSAAYGEHGVTKMLARRRIPKYVRSRSRKTFKNCASDGNITQ